MVKTAIFASGSGTNAENIIQTLSNEIEVVAIFCNNPNAGIIERAKKLDTQVVLFDRDQFYSTDKITAQLVDFGVEYVILAGFLWLIPDHLLAEFPDRIINIHPALLPKYGGKGMYGANVHKAVVANNEKESGITIHLVNEKYDDGKHLFQAKCSIDKDETPESLAKKIHLLEYECFPREILNYINSVN